jgi:hypothetical protein
VAKAYYKNVGERKNSPKVFLVKKIKIWRKKKNLSGLPHGAGVYFSKILFYF